MKKAKKAKKGRKASPETVLRRVRAELRITRLMLEDANRQRDDARRNVSALEVQLDAARKFRAAAPADLELRAENRRLLEQLADVQRAYQDLLTAANSAAANSAAANSAAVKSPNVEGMR